MKLEFAIRKRIEDLVEKNKFVVKFKFDTINSF